MNWTCRTECCAFLGSTLLGCGALSDVVSLCKPHVDTEGGRPLLIFNHADSRQIEVDFRGSLEEVIRRLPAPAPVPAETPTMEEEERPVRRGRPKLGVVAREVTLLPRHWEWLKSQPGGASVALRKLVEGARRDHAEQDRLRAAQDAAYRFISVMAGSLAGFEEATRALFAGDQDKFVKESAAWPEDIRAHARGLVARIFD